MDVALLQSLLEGTKDTQGFDEKISGLSGSGSMRSLPGPEHTEDGIRVEPHTLWDTLVYIYICIVICIYIQIHSPYNIMII